MPPKRKVGLTRMHAAYDAMRPMGFPTAVVRSCLRSLLKIYGNDGWAFIEGDAYKVLIEAILEELDSPQPEPEIKKLEAGDGLQHLLGSAPLLLEASANLETASTSRRSVRRPCYGLISDEERKVDDFVTLPLLDPRGWI